MTTRLITAVAAAVMTAFLLTGTDYSLAQGGGTFAPPDRGPDQEEGIGRAGGASSPELEADLAEARNYPPAILFTVEENGEYYNFGRAATLGARLAHKVLGGGIDLLVEDEGEGPLYNRVGHFGRVRAAVGHIFERTLAENAPYYERFGIPVILPFTDGWETRTLGRNFYQMMPGVPDQALVLAERTLKNPGKLGRVIILETPAPPFKLLADTYVDTLRDPKALSTGKQKRKALSSKVKVVRVVLDDMTKLTQAIQENKLNPQDVVLLALSSVQAVQVAPYFLESNFQKAIFLGGSSLATRDLCLAYVASNLNLELVVPLDMRNAKNVALSEFTHRYRIMNKQEPSWPSVMAYDAVAMAIKADSSPDGAMYLTIGDKGPEGIAGNYNFVTGKLPVEVVKVNRDSAVYYP
jgi:ABC-type branched-subunit amino acid transport system substrate-binding protein